MVIVRTSTRFRREATAVPSARAFVRHALRSAGASTAAVDSLVLAAAEACNNAVLHATGRDFTVGVTVDTCRAVVVVSDEGPGFRPPARRSMPEVQATGRRGLALMDALVERVDVSSGPAGTMVVLGVSLVAHDERPVPLTTDR